MSSQTRIQFEEQMKAIAGAVAGKAVDAGLEAFLNAGYGASSPSFAKIENLCRQAIAEGWMCEHGEDGRRWGRVSEPSPEMSDFSVDVVALAHGYGPHHSHPLGEIVLIMPQTPPARFDARGAGWLVYPPASSHYPTVTGGPALVLYLLHKGKIAFTK